MAAGSGRELQRGNYTDAFAGEADAKRHMGPGQRAPVRHAEAKSRCFIETFNPQP